MRAVVQRVKEASVRVGSHIIGRIDSGLVVLLGIHRNDGTAEADWLADKVFGLRIFEDDAGKLNRSLEEAKGGALIVSQFTLYGNCHKGRRPSYDKAAPPQQAEPLYEYFVNQIASKSIVTATGQFGAYMQLSLVNDGPVTLVIDSPTQTL